jgi:hypothetical protein
MLEQRSGRCHQTTETVPFRRQACVRGHILPRAPNLRMVAGQLGLVTLLVLVGCEYQQAPAPAAPGTPSAASPTPEPVKTSSPPPVKAVQPPARSAPAPPVPAAASAPSAAPVQVELSAGVALPQTGPTGTMMGFSVDYTFISGRPSGAAKYAWVVQRAKGPKVAMPVQLKAKGTLQTFLPDWRPSEGPFTCVLVELRADGSEHPLAASVTLR